MAQSRSSRHPLFVYSAPLGGGGGRGVAVEEEKKIKGEADVGLLHRSAGLFIMAGSRDTAKGRGCLDASVKGGGRAALGNAEEVERVFRHFDANGDGRISASELADVVRALSGSDGGAASDDEVRQMMEEMDADRDGYIDLAEFVEFHCGRGGGGGGGNGRGAAGAGDGEKELREAFRMYDLNGDGLISARELHQVLKRLGDKCSVRDCSRMINSVDADGDGSVNFQEFKKMMTSPGSNGGANSGKNRCRQPPK